jgi:Lar family restriction alleviation protein
MENKCMNEAINCPFCGAINQNPYFVGVEVDPENHGYYVHCYKCDTEGPFKTTKEKALEAWNTRYISEGEEKQHSEMLHILDSTLNKLKADLEFKEEEIVTAVKMVVDLRDKNEEMYTLIKMLHATLLRDQSGEFPFNENFKNEVLQAVEDWKTKYNI